MKKKLALFVLIGLLPLLFGCARSNWGVKKYDPHSLDRKCLEQFHSHESGDLPCKENPLFGLKKLDSKNIRMDLLVYPRKRDQYFKNFQDFFEFARKHRDRDFLKNIFSSVNELIRILNLNEDGYRIVIDEIPKKNDFFHFRISGGEPLGDTVQIEGKDSANHWATVDLKQNYSFRAHDFTGYIEKSSSREFREFVLGGERATSFQDIDPKAPVHDLVVPNGPYLSSFDFFSDASENEFQVLMLALKDRIDYFRENDIGENFFRIITNAGKNANQTQPHCHFHLLRGDQNKSLGNQVIAKKSVRQLSTQN